MFDIEAVRYKYPVDYNESMNTGMLCATLPALLTSSFVAPAQSQHKMPGCGGVSQHLRNGYQCDRTSMLRACTSLLGSLLGCMSLSTPDQVKTVVPCFNSLAWSVVPEEAQACSP